MIEKTLYLLVTNDEYETPVFEAFTLTEIADHLGMALSTVSRAFSRMGTVDKRRYRIIPVREKVEPRYYLKYKTTKGYLVIGQFEVLRDVAAYLGVSAHAVWRACNIGSNVKRKYKIVRNKAPIPYDRGCGALSAAAQ